MGNALIVSVKSPKRNFNEILEGMATAREEFPGTETDGPNAMTQREIIDFVTGMSDVVAVTASEADGSPEIAWGDTFFFHCPDHADPLANRRMPFATIVTKDYPGFDTVSDIDRDGVFRLNIAVGRDVFETQLGYPPAAHPDRSTGFDHTRSDRVLPHPVYAAQGWVCLLNPGAATADQARSLLTGAHSRAVRQHR